MTGEPSVNDTVTDVKIDYIPDTPVDVPGTSTVPRTILLSPAHHIHLLTD